MAGSLVSVFSLFRAGNLIFGLLILLFLVLLFAYLYHLSQKYTGEALECLRMNRSAADWNCCCLVYFSCPARILLNTLISLGIIIWVYPAK
ncbi:hypothetical protein HMPREF2628_04085 [Streptococcus sp. HMSC063B03]|nr:hypothetical protein HMPREF2628_04085 [Streptococcus sp. HMSC063B03]